jgi:ATP-dependent DNA helicase PIF1
MKGVAAWRANVPFGGKVVVMGGDFRQVLPVVPRGTRPAIVNACIKRSPLWQHVHVLPLTINMRVQRLLALGGTDAEAMAQQQFATDLLSIGEGTAVNPLLIPSNMHVPGDDPFDLIRSVYGDLSMDPATILPEALISRCILTPKNDSVMELGNMIMGIFPGQMTTYTSVDTVPEDENDQVAAYPTEFLNTLQPQGLPPHQLHLKVWLLQCV